MNIRTTKPESGNKFYNNGNNGGYSWCVDGSPKDRGCNVLANCVGYACGRFNEIIGEFKYKTLCCNAEYFIERAKAAGLQVGNTPKAGAIICWQKGSLDDGSDGCGHVAVVERVNSDGTILVSESAWNGSAFYTTTRNNNNGRWGQSSAYKFRGFIYNPAVKDEPVKPTPKKSVDELANEVLQGKWGNGADRKTRLTQAGYDYNAVQKRVNEKLAGNQPTKRYYTVVKGDTLYGIAQKFYGNGNRYPEIAKANNIKNANIINVGQKLLIP